MAEDMPADRHLSCLWMWRPQSREADCDQHVKCLLLALLHWNLTGLEAELRGVHTLLAVTGMKVPVGFRMFEVGVHCLDSTAVVRSTCNGQPAQMFPACVVVYCDRVHDMLASRVHVMWFADTMPKPRLGHKPKCFFFQIRYMTSLRKEVLLQLQTPRLPTITELAQFSSNQLSSAVDCPLPFRPARGAEAEAPLG
jgi:hypothetical protein